MYSYFYCNIEMRNNPQQIRIICTKKDNFCDFVLLKNIKMSLGTQSIAKKTNSNMNLEVRCGMKIDKS